MSNPRTTSSNGDGNKTSQDGDRKLPMAKALQQATQDFITLVGVEPESLSGVEATGDGWRFWLEVEELSRIPPSTSVMASYEVTTDSEGGIAGFRKARRYLRSQTQE